MKFLITGDTHGKVYERLSTAINTYGKEIALIILGDAGLNFYLNKTDYYNKRKINGLNIPVYCVRGNHEERPENLPNIQEVWDKEVHSYIYRESEFPYIRYFKDGEEYLIDGLRVLVIGGAYSVDKWHRLGRASADSKWTGWFPQEQLSTEEMETITHKVFGKEFDLVFSHTCPLDWEPTHLFLNFIDQSQVDKSMEIWLNTLKEKISFTGWLFGHYHADELVRPGVEMFFTDIEDIQTTFLRCKNPDETPWTFVKSPNYKANY